MGIDLLYSTDVYKRQQGLDRIGNVRSCRDYFVYWALEADSIYVHFGGPFYINDIIEREGTDNITGCNYGETHHDGLYANAFYRTKDRKAPQKMCIRDRCSGSPKLYGRRLVFLCFMELPDHGRHYMGSL